MTGPQTYFAVQGSTTLILLSFERRIKSGTQKKEMYEEHENKVIPR